MKELIRSNDPVRLSFAMAVLRDAGLHPFLADRFMSSAEGMISAVQQRLMIPEDEELRARRILDQAEAEIERRDPASDNDLE